MSQVFVKWLESKLMIGIDSKGHAIVLSSAPEHDPVWRGANPADLLMIAAASCSLYDVVEILQKQRQPFVNLEVACSGERQTEPVAKYVKMHLHYVAIGDVDPAKLERAIQLSIDKYCTVINTIKGCTEVTYDYEVRPGPK